MIYYFTIFLLFFFSIFNQFRLDKLGKNLLVATIFIYFIFLGGLRFEVGADWEPYKALFFDTSNWKDAFGVREEPTYLLVGLLIKNIVNNFSFFVFIIFFVSFYLKYSFIRKYSPDIFLSLIIYLYTIFLIYDVNGLRQGLAMGLTMLSVKYILSRNIYIYATILLIASLFHTSALIFIPFYFLSRIKINSKIICIALLLVVVLSIPLREFLKSSPIFQDALKMDSFDQYSVYTTDPDQKLDVPIISIAVFQRLFVFLLFMINYNRIKIEGNVKLLIRNGYLIGIVIFLIFSFSSEFAARLSFYYKAFEIIIIPLIVYSFSNKHQRLLFLILFTIFALFGVSRLLSIPFGFLIPYNNVLFL